MVFVSYHRCGYVISHARKMIRECCGFWASFERSMNPAVLLEISGVPMPSSLGAHCCAPSIDGIGGGIAVIDLVGGGASQLECRHSVHHMLNMNQY